VFRLRSAIITRVLAGPQARGEDTIKKPRVILIDGQTNHDWRSTSRSRSSSRTSWGWSGTERRAISW